MSLCLLGALAAVSGCEQVEPGASGTITVDPTVDLSKFDTLHIEAIEEDLGEDAPSGDNRVAGRRISTQVDLDAVDFPYDYTVGGQIGDPSSVKSWYVVARLTNEEDEDAADGRPIGTADFEVPSDSCRGEFCGVALDVDLEIEARTD